MVTKAQQIIPELFRLTQTEADIVASTDAQCEYTIRYDFATIWKYQVPVGQEFILLPEHKFVVYIEDDSTSVEWLNTQFVQVRVLDATQKRIQIIYQGRYIESKETQDLDKMAHLDLIEPLRLKSGDWIYVLGECPTVNAGGEYTIDVSDSLFSIECLRVRSSMY